MSETSPTPSAHAAGDRRATQASVQHGPLCAACGSATLVVHGEAVCPACIPPGATVDEIAVDRRVANGFSPAGKDAARRAIIDRTYSELDLIKDRVEFLVRRLDALSPSRETVSNRLAALDIGIATEPPTNRLSGVLLRYGHGAVKGGA